jgi:hypothetical protein
LTRRRISGAKDGTPLKASSSPSVSVSPMRSVPWFGMPTTVAREGLVGQGAV